MLDPTTNRENAAHSERVHHLIMYRPGIGIFTRYYDVLGTIVIPRTPVKEVYDRLKKLTNGGVFDTMRLQEILEDLRSQVWEPEYLPRFRIIS